MQNLIIAAALTASLAAPSNALQSRAAPVVQGRSVTHFDTLSADSGRTTKSATRALQRFVANGTHVSTIEIEMTCAGLPKVEILGTGTHPNFEGLSLDRSAVGARIEALAQAGSLAPATPAVTKDGGSVRVRFDPPFGVVAGELYTVRITAPAQAAFSCRTDDAYLWSSAQGGSESSLSNWARDLAMKVAGSSSAPEKDAPSKRALLVLLENGGFTLDGIPGFEDAAPRIDYWTCGDLEFEAKKNEGLDAFLQRIGAELWECLECLDPSNWKKGSIRLDSWMPDVSDFVLEEFAKAIAILDTSSGRYRYDRVVVLEDGKMKASNVLAKIDQLAKDHLLDVHVLTHGGVDRIVGKGEERLDVPNFFRKLAQRRARGDLHLRAVYQMNCQSGTLVPEWRAAGADVVNGTVGEKNNYMPTQYFGFLKHWLDGEQFDEAVRLGFEAAKPPFLLLYARDPSLIESSRMVVSGAKNRRITD